MTDKNVKRLIESIDTIDAGKIAIEPEVDSVTGVKSLGYKDSDGNARRVLTTEKLTVLALKSELGDATSLAGFNFPSCGDSNMIGFSAGIIPSTVKLGELTGFTFHNLGVGGKTSDEILDEQIPNAIKLSHKHVLIMSGTNDTPSGYTVADTIGYLESMYMEVINSGRIPVAIHILPGASGTYKTERDEINAWISTYSSVNSILVVTVEEFDDGSGGLKAEYDNGDTVHLNDVGQVELANQIYAQTALELSTETDLQKGSFFGTMAPTNNNIDDDFRNWSVPENLGTFTTGVLAPDGSNTAYGISADATDDEHTLQQVATPFFPVAGVRYDGVFAKANLSKYLRIKNTGTGALIKFNLEGQGGVYQPAGARLNGYGTLPVGDDWHFCYIRCDSTLTNSSIRIEILRDINTTTWIGDGSTPEVYLWKPLHADSMNAQFIDRLGSVPPNFRRNLASNLFECPDSTYPYEYDTTEQADSVAVEASAFAGTLSPSDDNVQKALATIDNGVDAVSLRLIDILDTMPAGGLAQGYSLIVNFLENAMRYSQDITQASVWIKWQCTLDGTDGIIANSTDITHYVKQTIEITSEYTFVFEAKPEDKDFVFLQYNSPESGVDTVYLGLSGKIEGAKTGDIVATDIVDSTGGFYKCYVQASRLASVGEVVTMHPAETISDSVFQGDGVTVDIRFKNMQVVHGDIALAKTLPYVATTTDPKVGAREYVPTDTNGASGTFTSVTVVDGIVTAGT